MLELKVTGVKELQKALAALNGEFEEAVTMALAASGMVVKNAASATPPCPYLSGNLSRSYHVVPIRPGESVSFAPLDMQKGIENTSGEVITIALKEGQTAVVVGTDVVYAATQEYLNVPHLRPALDENKKAVEDEFARAIDQIIKRHT